MLPGKYTIKFLARDDETGRIGTYQSTLVIPNLNKELKRLPISSVVLSSQRVDLKDALYSAIKGKDQDKNIATNPLVQNGQKIIPSVTRTFSRSKQMYVYLQAYEQGVATTQPLIAFVSFYRDYQKVFETQPVKVAQGLNNRLYTVSLNFSINLGQLPPERYDCQATVLNPTGQRVAFWQAPIMLVP